MRRMLFSDLLEEIHNVDAAVTPDTEVRLVRGLGGTPTATYVQGMTYVSEADRRDDGEGGIFYIVAGQEVGYVISDEADAIETGVPQVR